MNARIATLVTLAALVVAGPAVANPVDAFGLGARGIALGGAMTATAVDYSANYYNPAGLAAEQDLRLEVGYIYVDPELYLNGGDLDVDRTYGIQGGVVVPGTLFGHDVAVSFGTYMPAERITRIRALAQHQPRWTLYDNRPQRLVITSSLAFEIVEDLTLGFGLTYLSDTRGTLDVGGLVHFADAEQTSLFSAVDVQLDSVRYPSAGIMFTPGDHWRFGMAWREEFALELELVVAVHGDIYWTNPPPQAPVASGSFDLTLAEEVLFTPRQLAWGVAYEADRWMLALDLTWLDWSRFPAPAAQLDITLDLANPVTDAPFPLELPPVDEPIAPGFHDIWIPRIGFEYDLVDGHHFGLAARAGYFYEPTPAPDQPGRTNYIDTDKHGLSCGLGFRFEEFSSVFPRPLLLDFGFQYITMPSRRYEKDDPADPIGDYVADGHFVGGSINLSFLF